MASLLKSWFGDAATPENEFGYGWLPKVDPHVDYASLYIVDRMLKEKRENSEFLLAKSGHLFLHCSLCGHTWGFSRQICPACGETGHERRDLYLPEGRERERIHTCSACGRYLLVLNQVECDTPIDLDLAPVTLLHLDIVAQGKGYLPLAMTPWNNFGDLTHH